VSNFALFLASLVFAYLFPVQIFACIRRNRILYKVLYFCAYCSNMSFGVIIRVESEAFQVSDCDSDY